MKSTKKQMDEAFGKENTVQKGEQTGTDWQKFYPLCPYCEKEIFRVNQYLITPNQELEYPGQDFSLVKIKRKNVVVVSCPYCRKIFGVY